MVLINFGADKTTAWNFLLGSSHESLQANFIATTCAGFSFIGYCFIYVLYSILILSMIDIALCLVMLIPTIRKNFFMALLYKTFLIFFGFFELLCYLITLVFMILYFVSVGRAGVSIGDFFTSIQVSNPVLWITLITFFITVVISMVKLMAYRNYKRPV